MWLVFSKWQKSFQGAVTLLEPIDVHVLIFFVFISITIWK